MRAPVAVLMRNTPGPSGLWHRISGDLPIVLVRIDELRIDSSASSCAREYWRMKGLAVDLVIPNEKPPSYLQDLQTALEGWSIWPAAQEGGSVFVLRGDLLSSAERDCLGAAARVIL
jgi:cyclic beta-1,2-glucan synthetase